MKRLFIILTVLALTFTPALAQRPKVALVLSGGGAKGAAHVGVLKVLEEYEIPIDIITGTSMGALIGGLYAVGHSAAELDSLVTSQDWDYVISGQVRREEVSYEQKTDAAKYLIQIPFGIDWSSALGSGVSKMSAEDSLQTPESHEPTIVDLFNLAPEGSSSAGLPMGLMAGQKIYSLLSDCTIGYHSESDFTKFPIPFACVATDLVSGKEVVFDSGILPIALRASMAIPGVFPPVKTNDMVLVDGGLRNNFPVDVARAMGADIVIGVKTPSDSGDLNLNSLGGMLSKVITITTTSKLEEAIAATDIFIQPSIGKYGTMSFDNESLRELITNGETAAREVAPKLVELKKMLDDKVREHDETFYGPMPAPRPTLKATKLSDTIMLSSIKFVGLSEKDEAFLRRDFKLKPDTPISIDDIENTVNELYATKAYNSVVYTLDGEHSPFNLIMTMVPARNHRLGVGLRFDTEEISSILLDLGFNYNSLYGSRFNISGRFANLYQFGVGYSYMGRNITRFDASYNLRHSAMQLRTDDRSRYNVIDYLQNSFKVTLSSGHLRKLGMEGGLMADLYYYRTALDAPQVPESYSADESRFAFFGPFVKLGMDNLDNAWFPTRGIKFNSQISYLTDFDHSQETTPFLDASLSFKWVISPGSRLAVAPFVNARALLGKNAPVAMMNCFGGNEAGRYCEQQIPFYGTLGVTAAEPLLAVAGLDFRYNLYKSHYLLLAGNYVRDGHSLASFVQNRGIYGVRAGYAFDFIAGPLEVDLLWNSISRSAGVYLSLGFWF